MVHRRQSPHSGDIDVPLYNTLSDNDSIKSSLKPETLISNLF